MLVNDELLMCKVMEPLHTVVNVITKPLLAILPSNEQLWMTAVTDCLNLWMVLTGPIFLNRNDTNDIFIRTSGIINACIETWLLRGRIDESPTP